MSKADKERQARRQRMLARERGHTSTYPIPGTSGDIGLRTPQPVRRSRGTTPPPTPEKQPDNVKSFTPLIQQRQRRHYTVLAVLILCIAAAVFVFTGAMSASIALLGDAADSLSLYFNRSDGGWPANTGISEPIQIAELAGGFVELDSEDVVVYSAYGAKVRSFQPGYARPVMAVGGTHFVVYNRAGSDLQVSSRTKALYTKTFDNSILLCAMSNNNTLAVVTESGRYAAQLQIFDPSFRQTYSWEMTQNEGTPIAVAFSPDNRQFAAGTLAARQGQLGCKVYFMSTSSNSEGPAYTASQGSMLLSLDWQRESRVVAVFGCGGDRDREKRPQMGRIVSRLADVAVVTSDNPRWEQPEKIIEDILPGLTGPAESVVICDRREAIGWVLKNSRPRDVIVLCGKGHETYQEVCGEKRHMDERELVAAYTNG